MADTSKKSDGSASSGWGDFFKSLPLDELKHNLTDYASAWGEKTIKGLGDKASSLFDGLGSADSPVGKAAQKGAEKLAEGDSPIKAGLSGAATGVKEQVKDVFTGGGGSKGSNRGAKKVTNIVETIEVGVPISVAYNQWTQFEDWSDFMKKVENVEQESEEKVNIKGQVFWSHRTWDSTIIQQVADEQIVWRSTGQKGHLDGAVTFHRLGPRLTRILVVVEYYPQGFMEKTGNIWRAVGRRVQVELKRYVRQIMTSTILDPDAVEGWRGEIRDSEVVRTHEEVVEEEQARAEQGEDNENASEQESQTDADGDTTSAAEDATEQSDAAADSDEVADYDEEYVEDEPVEDFEDIEDEDEEYVDEEPEDEEYVDEEPVAEDDEPVDEEFVEEDGFEDEPVEDEVAEVEAEDEEDLEEEPPEDEEVEEESIDEGEEADEESESDDDEVSEDEDETVEDEPNKRPAKKTASKSSGSKSSASSSKRSSSGTSAKRASSSNRSKATKASGGNKSSNRSTGQAKNTRSTRSTTKGKTQKSS